jgi:glutathione S-transferase
MTVYKLMYWNARGRGEQVRLLLNELGLEYEDVHVERGSERFREIQAQGPKILYFGAVPMLQDDEFKLCQGPVILSYLAAKHGIAPADLRQDAKADAICWGAEDLRIAYFLLFGPTAADDQAEFVAGPWRQQWLRSLDGLLELNGDTGFFVGKSLTHADIAVWDILDSIKTWVAGASVEGFPRLERFVEAIATRPRIATYLDSDRRPQS